MDKQTESRSQFEAWWEKVMNTQEMDLHWSDNWQSYSCHETNRAWLAWQKSRESLVVELPGKIAHLNTSSAGIPDERGTTYDIAIDKCAEAIRAIGIRIKGEGV